MFAWTSLPPSSSFLPLPPPPPPPPAAAAAAAPTLVKLTVNARDRRFELTFTSPRDPSGLSAARGTCLRTVAAVYLQVTVVLVVDVFFLARLLCFLA